MKSRQSDRSVSHPSLSMPIPVSIPSFSFLFMILKIKNVGKQKQWPKVINFKNIIDKECTIENI